MVKKLQIIAIIFLCVGYTNAQTFVADPCGQMGVLDKLESQYPGFKTVYDKMYLQQVHPKVLANRKKWVKDTMYTYDTTFTVQVVFHVLYNVSSENISDALIKSQLAVLNECYRKQNADTINIRSIFKKRAGDTRIQFVFAGKDPSGNATNGIVHKYTSKTMFESANFADEMKSSALGGDDAWDPATYLNIWVCDMRYQGTEGLLGYAFPPYGQPNWPSSEWVADNRQGVVLFYKIVGKNNPLATGSFASAAPGEIAVHEVGHYFGLRHIWGDATNFNRCQVDDYIDDTPKQGAKSSFDCNKSQNTCIDGSPDEPDMVENWMDYSSNACQNMFTAHQINVMRLGITNFRNTLPLSIKIDTFMHVLQKVVYENLKFYVTSKQRIYFELNNDNLLENLSVDIFDLTGKKIVADFQLKLNENYLSTSNFAPAYYIVCIKNTQNKFIQKRQVYIHRD